ncbi:MAG: D-aminoacyl-tRNA deacylase, partial [Dehalococcoidia bacterium]|nr:D-aminoacyl-tRNA deacylase [Dehalococcoidia bacterium]
FNLSLVEVAGQALVVSQFTQLAKTRRGRRHSFDDSSPPEVAEVLVDRFCQFLRDDGIPVESGLFGAHIEVELINDGPVTIILYSVEFTNPRRSNGPQLRLS